MSPPSRGIAFITDAHGVVQRVLRDDFGLDALESLPRPMAALFTPSSIAKAFELLRRIAKERTATDWEATLRVGEQHHTLRFVGATYDDAHTLIVGSESRNGTQALCEALTQINNDQSNALRASARAAAAVTRHSARDEDLYEDLTRLNNQLVSMQRELARKNVQLERLNQQKNELLGMAAHDLRNPLGVILGYARFLLMDGEKLDAKQRKFLDAIVRSSNFMNALVSDLLDISAIEAGHLELKEAPTDLTDLVRQVLDLERLIADRKDIEVVLARADETGSIRLDERKIEQVLHNLVSNAVKYSHSGTKIEVSIAQEGDVVRVAVRDEGQGIPLDEQAKLFTPFQKASVRTTAGEKSTGLGLAIARKIVEAHKGRITLQSEPGVGSTFEINLPVDAT